MNILTFKTQTPWTEITEIIQKFDQRVHQSFRNSKTLATIIRAVFVFGFYYYFSRQTMNAMHISSIEQMPIFLPVIILIFALTCSFIITHWLLESLIQTHDYEYEYGGKVKMVVFKHAKEARDIAILLNYVDCFQDDDIRNALLFEVQDEFFLHHKEVIQSNCFEIYHEILSLIKNNELQLALVMYAYLLYRLENMALSPKHELYQAMIQIKQKKQNHDALDSKLANSLPKTKRKKL